MDTSKMQEGYEKWVAAGKPAEPPAIKASFKSKMNKLDPEWPDKIWNEVMKGNRVGPHPSNEKYAAWIAAGKPPKPMSIMLAVAALALTGVRPTSLESGVTFSMVEIKGIDYLQAFAHGAKIIRDDDGNIVRGQEEIRIVWRMSHPVQRSHRNKEMVEIMKAMNANLGNKVTIKYHAEAISTALRLVSKKLWPRRKHHVSASCYRELFSETAKAAGMPPEFIAAAMGHRSTRSQEKYQKKSRAKGGVAPDKVDPPFSMAFTSSPIKIVEPPEVRIAEFKAQQKSKVVAAKILKSVAPH